MEIGIGRLGTIKPAENLTLARFSLTAIATEQNYHNQSEANLAITTRALKNLEEYLTVEC